MKRKKLKTLLSTLILISISVPLSTFSYSLTESSESEIKTLINQAPIIGDSLSNFTSYANKSNLISINNNNLNESSFISIDNSNEKSVTNIDFNIKTIAPEGITKDQCIQLLNSFLGEDVINAYKVKSSYTTASHIRKSFIKINSNNKSTEDIKEDSFSNNLIFTVNNLKLSNKIDDKLPKKLSIIVASNESTKNITNIILSKSDIISIDKLSKIKASNN